MAEDGVSNTNQNQALEENRILLERWRDQVLPHLLTADKWTEVSSQFAQIAVRSALIVNGAALVALPPLMEWVAEPRQDALVCASFWFVAGLLLAFVVLFLAYYNFLFMSQTANFDAHMAAIRVNNPDQSRQGRLAEIPEYEEYSRKMDNAQRYVGGTQIGGVIVLVASVAFFLIGIANFGSIVTEREERQYEFFFSNSGFGVYVDHLVD